MIKQKADQNGLIDEHTLETVKGKGNWLSLSLRLSRALSNVMSVASGGQLFGVPMDAVLETVRVPIANVHLIKQRQATVLRGRIVPLLALIGLLGLTEPPLANADDELAALVVRLARRSGPESMAQTGFGID